MGCFTDCLGRNWLRGVILGALIGAGIGLLISFLECIALGGTLGLAGGPPGAVVGIGIVCTFKGAVLWPILIVVVITGAVIGALLGLLAVIMGCGITCGVAASSVNAPGIVNQAVVQAGIYPDGALDCQAATATVESLENQLTNAKAARDGQENIAESRNSALTAARNAIVIAVTVLAGASFWNPVAVAVAAVAVALAMTALAIALRRFVEEQVKLAELNAKVVALEAALAVAREVKEGLCGKEMLLPGDMPAMDSVGVIDTSVASSTRTL